MRKEAKLERFCEAFDRTLSVDALPPPVATFGDYCASRVRVSHSPKIQPAD
jgi:hypothetical protein